MVKVFIFDLDGTLVQTEILKAKSYAKAAVEMSEGRVDEQEVIEAFKDVVGLSRRDVAENLLNRFDLETAAKTRMKKFEVDKPWQAFVQLRLGYYEEMLEDPRILHEHRCPYNLGLLDYVRQQEYLIGLATMSRCRQANMVLDTLGIRGKFNFIAFRDDVESGKPDPEIYQLVASELNASPQECLVIEDSPSGIRAALNAKMGCIAVTTDFSRRSIHESSLLDQKWIVDDRSRLKSVAEEYVRNSIVFPG